MREAAVVAAPEAYRGETVKGYVSLRWDTATADLVAWRKDRIAAYKCPREVEILSDLPKTATGRILPRELRG